MFSLLALLLTSSTAVLAASTVTVSAAPTPTSTSYTDDATFEKDMLEAHNFYRGQHNASSLSWNDTSAKVAEGWSEGCEFEHSVRFSSSFPSFLPSSNLTF